MIISEIDVEKFIARQKKAQKRTAKLSGGLTGKGGQIGDVLRMVEKHNAFWEYAVKQNLDSAKTNPIGLLNAWIEKFYGTSSVKINIKKAKDDGAIGYHPGMKGVEAIFRIVTKILLTPKSEREASIYREQILKQMPSNLKKDIGYPGVKMPTSADDPNPSGAQNQVGAKKTASDGNEYEWKGAQWVGTKTGRIATKKIAAELGK